MFEEQECIADTTSLPVFDEFSLKLQPVCVVDRAKSLDVQIQLSSKSWRRSLSA